MYLNYPMISYNDILFKLSEKYNIKKCYFTLKQFNNFKNNFLEDNFHLFFKLTKHKKLNIVHNYNII